MISKSQVKSQINADKPKSSPKLWDSSVNQSNNWYARFTQIVDSPIICIITSQINYIIWHTELLIHNIWTSVSFWIFGFRKSFHVKRLRSEWSHQSRPHCFKIAFLCYCFIRFILDWFSFMKKRNPSHLTRITSQCADTFSCSLNVVSTARIRQPSTIKNLQTHKTWTRFSKLSIRGKKVLKEPPNNHIQENDKYEKSVGEG